jgi:hypothetical protein
MLWNLTEEVASEDQEVQERSALLGEKLGKYFVSQIVGIAPRGVVNKRGVDTRSSGNLVDEAAKHHTVVDEMIDEADSSDNQRELQNNQDKEKATLRRPGKNNNDSTASVSGMPSEMPNMRDMPEMSRSMRGRTVKRHIEVKMRMIQPTYDVMARLPVASGFTI